MLVGDPVEHRVGGRLRHVPHGRPAAGVGQRRTPVLHRRLMLGGRVPRPACPSSGCSWRRTSRTRWTTVITVSTARMPSGYGHRPVQAEPGARAARPGRISRSARSAMPHVRGRAHALRAGLGVGDDAPPTRHTQAPGSSVERSDARPTSTSTPPKIAPSATRSSVESRKVPRALASRAAAPSSRRACRRKTKMNSRTSRRDERPRGKKTSAATDGASVVPRR